MKRLKPVLRNAWVRGAICAVAALYIRLVHATSRWSVAGGEHAAALWDRDAPFIVAFWHGRLMMMPYCWRRGKSIEMLISQHRDGQLIARTIGHFDFPTIAGSTSRGGSEALRAMLRGLKRGGSIGITPDGPRGPRMRAGGGIADVARLSGAPILPLAFATSRRVVLGSWDRFIVALPFSRGVYVWGAPIEVPKGGDEDAREAARRLIEERLNAVTAEADRLVGQSVIEPAPLGAGS
ncbi:MAG: lysophospholipid acyltransferase family protein [Proteobacteria bacterium]|nr:lysophospholipid acyltransferase family protein [Pseudomonadota bacterium]